MTAALIFDYIIYLKIPALNKDCDLIYLPRKACLR